MYNNKPENQVPKIEAAMRAALTVISKSEIVGVRYQEKMKERKALRGWADYNGTSADLAMPKAEVGKSLRGESSFSQCLLSSLIADSERNCLK